MPKSKFVKEMNTLRGIKILLFARKKESLMLMMLAYNMLNKNTQGAKKGEANPKQQLSDYTCD